MTYTISDKDRELPLHETPFSVISTSQPDSRTLPRVIDTAIVRVLGEKVLERRESRLLTSPPHSSRMDMQAEVSKLVAMLEGTVLTSFDLVRDVKIFNFMFSSYGFDGLGNETVSIRRLARLLLPELPKYDMESIASHFNLRILDIAYASRTADIIADVLIELLRNAGGQGIGSFSELRDLLDTSREPIDWKRYAFDRTFFHYLPPCPGVYMMANRRGEIIYVGKALSLRERVRSYFTGKEEKRIEGLREAVFDISYEQTGCVLSALLQEAELILGLKPVFNTILAGEDLKKPASRESRTGKSFGGPTGSRGCLLFLPAVRQDEIDLVLLFEDKALWRTKLSTGLLDLPTIMDDLFSFITDSSPHEELSPQDLHLIAIVESWLQRNEDLVNLIEIDGDEDRTLLEEKIRLFVESGDWQGEKMVYRL